ncbi:hypothetical protein GRX01_00260 [Halobaculum sp. WSA2]|uniref:Uncharacterized protein n=1 Tax=Halobaculum saliterrae TaxID=2073113 RepID=A0A6B0SQD0_9EURY|nr:hypothetical protein [Halobaculum saliterrae]MXR39796.1 hypothetical protein [Halobaculum saliterrae]
MDALRELAVRVVDLLSVLAGWVWRLVGALVALAAVVVAVGIGWLLVVVRLARAAPHLGGDDQEGGRDTTWLPPRRGT